MFVEVNNDVVMRCRCGAAPALVEYETLMKHSAISPSFYHRAISAWLDCYVFSFIVVANEVKQNESYYRVYKLRDGLRSTYSAFWWWKTSTRLCCFVRRSDLDYKYEVRNKVVYLYVEKTHNIKSTSRVEKQSVAGNFPTTL